MKAIFNPGEVEINCPYLKNDVKGIDTVKAEELIKRMVADGYPESHSSVVELKNISKRRGECTRYPDGFCRMFTDVDGSGTPLNPKCAIMGEIEQKAGKDLFEALRKKVAEVRIG